MILHELLCLVRIFSFVFMRETIAQQSRYGIVYGFASERNLTIKGQLTYRNMCKYEGLMVETSVCSLL